MMDEIHTRVPAEAHRGLLLSLFRQWLTSGLDLLYPPRCAGCGRVDTLWCSRCQQEIDAIPFPDRLAALPPLRGRATTGVHDGKLQQAVHALKYENGRALAITLGERLSRCLEKQGWTIDIIIPVPLHIRREKARGYNQAQLLGAYVAAQHNLPLVCTAITRRRDTAAQVGLTRDQRQANVYGAFSANPTEVTNQKILLIDDVFTTGATLQACAQAALDAGAAAAYSLTVTAARI
jgi:ComF family protein